MLQETSNNRREDAVDFDDNALTTNEVHLTEANTENKEKISLVSKIIHKIKKATISFYNINYSVCITVGLICGILSVVLSNQKLPVKYANNDTPDFLFLSSLLLILSILIASYIALALLIRLITSHVQYKKKGFSHTIYSISAISDNLSIMIIGLGTILVSSYYDNNFQFLNSINFNMLSHDLIGLIILGNFILALMTLLVKIVSFNFNRDTFMERMLTVLRVDYFLKLIEIIKLHDQKSITENTSCIWEYGFPWIEENANLSEYQTDKSKKIKTLYFTPNINQITPELRNWIYKEFKKQPESILFGTNHINLHNLDMKPKNDDKYDIENIKTVGEIAKYFASQLLFDNFCRVLNLSRETHLKTFFLSNMFRRNSMEKRHIQASLAQINGCLRRIQISCYIVICTMLVIYTSLVGYGSTPVLFTVVSAFFGTGFAFQPSVKHAIDNVLFLLCIHPYDVGDRIFIELDEKVENLVVHELNVFSTVFTKFDGSLSIVSNGILKTKEITNVRRSGFMAETYKISVNADVKTEKLALIRAKIGDYVNEKPDDFTGAIMLNIETVEDANKMSIKIYVQYKRNWHDYNTYLKLKHELLQFIVLKLNENGIEYKMPVQPIHITKQLYDKH